MALGSIDVCHSRFENNISWCPDDRKNKGRSKKSINLSPAPLPPLSQSSHHRHHYHYRNNPHYHYRHHRYRHQLSHVGSKRRTWLDSYSFWNDKILRRQLIQVDTLMEMVIDITLTPLARYDALTRSLTPSIPSSWDREWLAGYFFCVFLVACTRFYKSLCRSVRRSVSRSVRPSHFTFFAFLSSLRVD